MQPAGRALIEAAKADGSWTLLDSVEALEEPEDLAAALAVAPGARRTWDESPPSARKVALYWLVQARSPTTRAKRIAEIVARCSRGERPR
jgi:uncharacterized protein YdeI (YjbR/CyaY-like superfamily)